MRRHILIFLSMSALSVGGFAATNAVSGESPKANPATVTTTVSDQPAHSTVITVRVGPGDKAEYMITKNGERTPANWKDIESGQIYNPDTSVPSDKYGILLFMKDPAPAVTGAAPQTDELVQRGRVPEARRGVPDNRGRVPGYRPYLGGRGYYWGGYYYPYYYPYYYNPAVPVPGVTYPYTVPGTTYPYTYPYVCGTYGAWPYIYYNYCY